MDANMKKLLLILGLASFISGCQSGAPSYYEMDSYAAILKEMQKVTSTHIWVPANYRQYDTMKDPVNGDVKLLFDSYFSKEKITARNAYKVWFKMDGYANNELFSRSIMLSMMDCSNAGNDSLKMLLYRVYKTSLDGGKEGFAAKMIATDLGTGFESRWRIYTPEMVFPEVRDYASIDELDKYNAKLATPEITKMQNQFRGLICSNSLSK